MITIDQERQKVSAAVVSFALELKSPTTQVLEL